MSFRESPPASHRTTEIQPDLQQALVAHPGADTNFAAFPRSVKRGILEWIATAKKPETRAKRLDETGQLAAQNTRANQWRKQPSIRR